jgi:hypothetical protein
MRSRPARGRQVDDLLCDELPSPLKRRAPGADTTLVKAHPSRGGLRLAKGKEDKTWL